MKLERGFRRIATVLSVALLGIGVALDTFLMLPHATLEVILRDGRSFILERHTTKKYLTDWQDIARDLANGRGVYERGLKDAPVGHKDHPSKVPRPDSLIEGKPDSFVPDFPPPDWVSAEAASRIRAVLERREAHYQWWRDSDWTKTAVALVALLWLIFYTVRWIVRGFTGS